MSLDQGRGTGEQGPQPLARLGGEFPIGLREAIPKAIFREQRVESLLGFQKTSCVNTQPWCGPQIQKISASSLSNDPYNLGDHALPRIG